MKEFLVKYTSYITNFLARYHIPIPLAVVVTSLILGLFLLSIFFISNTPNSQTELYPSPAKNDSEQPYSPSSNPTFSPGDPTPTTHPDVYYQNDPEYKKSVDEVNAEEQIALSKDKAVANFMDSLPYQGTNIKVTYSISDNIVRLILKSSNQTQANKEFDDLLKQRGIQSRNWIPDLIITVE